MFGFTFKDGIGQALCMCVCVCTWVPAHVRLCVCVCVGGSGAEQEGDSWLWEWREQGHSSGKLCVCEGNYKEFGIWGRYGRLQPMVRIGFDFLGQWL